MVKRGQSRHEGEKVSMEKPKWYITWWGFLCIVLIILLIILIVRFRSKVKIEVSNCFVALLAVGFTYIFLKILRTESKAAKLIIGLIWLLFLPNTAYLFTDLGHITYQWRTTVSVSGHILLLFQYILFELFGIIAFIFSFLPFEKITAGVNAFKKRKVMWLILFNFLISYGLVLGRFEHINSWIIFKSPQKVLKSALNIFMSFELLKLTFLFGLLCCIIYFLFRGLLLKLIMKYSYLLDD